MRLIPYLLAALTAAASGASAQMPTPRADSRDASQADSSHAGDVALAITGLLGPVGAEARYYVADGLSVGVSWDQSPFASDDPSFQSGLYDSALAYPALYAQAFTISVSAVSEIPLAGNWLFYGMGIQAYYQRQVDDVLEGYDADRAPIVSEEQRRSDGAGVALDLRMEARVVGPLRVGFAASGPGLGLRRTRGGTVPVRQNRPIPAQLEKDEESLRFHSSGRSAGVYLSARF